MGSKSIKGPETRNNERSAESGADACVCARCARLGQTCCGLGQSSGQPDGQPGGPGGGQGSVEAAGQSVNHTAHEPGEAPDKPASFDPVSPSPAGKPRSGPGADEASGRSEFNCGNEAECFPVSRAERERILRAIGALPLERLRDCPAGRDSLFKPHPNTPSFIASINALFPRQKARVAALYPAGSSHLRMNLTAEGNCALLAPDGCALPREARPWFCRIYPFWVMGRQLACFAPEDCLAVRENRTPGLLLRAFATDKQTILKIYNNLCADWGFPELETGR